MARHNNMIPNGHFHKDWKRRVKINFDQPFKKLRRNHIRTKKLIAMTPRPVDVLRPNIQCPTSRYNSKLRKGRGFTKQELNAANLNMGYAKSIGIAVDRRRRNKSHDSVLRNMQVLKTYISKLVIFPQQDKKVEPISKYIRQHLNKSTTIKLSTKGRVPTEEEKKLDIFTILRKARTYKKSLSKKLKRKKSVTDQFDK